MKTKDFIEKYGACKAGSEWAMSVSDDMAQVWDALIKEGRRNWLLWVLTSQEIYPKKTLMLLSCRFVRETPIPGGRTVWDLLSDPRSRNAVETAERFAEGKATKHELNASYAAYAAVNAAYAAADAAYHASYAAYHAAYDAADAAYHASYAAYHASYAAHASYASYAAVNAAYAAAYDAADAADAANAAQVRMISELGNPFKDENDPR